MKTGLEPGDLAFLVTLASSVSLTTAALELGFSTAAVSKGLKRFEQRTGVALVKRRSSLEPGA